VPQLAGWATPEGWLQGLRPRREENSTSSERTVAGAGCTGDSHSNGNAADAQINPLVHAIEQMEQVVGKRMYRGVLKAVAKVWNPKDIKDPAIQQKVLAHMQAAERGLRRAEAAREKAGLAAFGTILQRLQLRSLDQVDNLKTLQEILVALETAARNANREHLVGTVGCLTMRGNMPPL
jgi:hypothetical protein